MSVGKSRRGHAFFIKKKYLYTINPYGIRRVYMRIDIIRISPYVLRKLYEKHNILAEEIRQVLEKNEPIFKKVGGNQYVAIGRYYKYLTIFFTYDEKTKQATITTAYASDKKQVRYYKRLRR